MTIVSSVPLTAAVAVAIFWHLMDRMSDAPPSIMLPDLLPSSDSPIAISPLDYLKKLYRVVYRPHPLFDGGRW
jgi:hypothetical protein